MQAAFEPPFPGKTPFSLAHWGEVTASLDALITRVSAFENCLDELRPVRELHLPT